MMIKEIYSVKDKKSGFNSPLGLYDNKALALRDFQNACKIPNSLISNNPEDFCLFKIGTFDTDKGSIVADFEKIAEASSFVVKPID